MIFCKKFIKFLSLISRMSAKTRKLITGKSLSQIICFENFDHNSFFKRYLHLSFTFTLLSKYFYSRSMPVIMKYAETKPNSWLSLLSCAVFYCLWIFGKLKTFGLILPFKFRFGHFKSSSWRPLTSVVPSLKKNR